VRRRIYWLMPHLASARWTMQDLLEAGVDSACIHFAAAEGSDLTGLHEANIWQTSDVVRAAKNGLLIGCALGACVGLVAAALFPLVEDDITWELSAMLALLGGLMGAWSQPAAGALCRRAGGRPDSFDGGPAARPCTAHRDHAGENASGSPFRGRGRAAGLLK